MSFHMQKKTRRLTTGGGGAAYNVTKSLIKEVFWGGGEAIWRIVRTSEKTLARPQAFFFHSSNEIGNTHRANVLRILAFLSLSFGQKSALVLPSDSGDCPFFSSL